MVEWYRAGDGMQEGMQTLSDLCQSILDCAPAERISYRDAFLRHVGVEPHTASIAELNAVAARRNISVPQGLAGDRDGLLQLLLSELVEPHLGTKAPTILFDYPASQAALAQVRNEEYPVAERFELYINGIELANGYHELLDYQVLQQRNAEINQERIADGKPALPNESRLLAAMKHGLPACCGTALGFDRLAMIASGAATIDQVLAFPIDRA